MGVGDALGCAGSAGGEAETRGCIFVKLAPRPGYTPLREEIFVAPSADARKGRDRSSTRFEQPAAAGCARLIEHHDVLQGRTKCDQFGSQGAQIRADHESPIRGLLNHRCQMRSSYSRIE